MFVNTQALFVTVERRAGKMLYTGATMKDETKHAIGKRIAAARQAAGLSQSQLAKHLGVTQQMVGYLERQPVAIRPELLARLSEVLHVPVDELVGVKVSAKRATGPTGRVRQAFEAVSRLPRRKQQKIIEVVEALVAQNNNA
jgi:transcriptional regulator with XRE-family HTH domain